MPEHSIQQASLSCAPTEVPKDVEKKPLTCKQASEENVAGSTQADNPRCPLKFASLTQG